MKNTKQRKIEAIEILKKLGCKYLVKRMEAELKVDIINKK